MSSIVKAILKLILFNFILHFNDIYNWDLAHDPPRSVIGLTKILMYGTESYNFKIVI